MMSFIALDTRAVASILFRRLGRIIAVIVAINVLVLSYIFLAEPQFLSSAKLLIKFGQDARPEVSTTTTTGLTAEEKRGLVQSNLNILTSRDLAEALLTDIGIDKVYPKIVADPPARGTVLDAAVRQLTKQLGTKTQSDAATINVYMLHPDPQMSTQMLKRLIELFLQRQTEIYNNPQKGFIEQQSQEILTRLTTAKAKLSAFQTSVGIASIDEELTLLLGQRSELESYITRRQDAPTAEASQAVPARLPSPGDSSRAPVLDDIQEELARLRARESELLQTYRADSDQVKAVRRSIAQQQARLGTTVAVLREQIAELDRKIEVMRTHKTTSDELSLQVQLEEESYRAAQQRLQAAQANDALNREKITSFSVIEQPTVPYRPVAPNKLLLVALGLILSGLFALLLVILSELFDPTISRAEQVKPLLGEPLLASLPLSVERSTTSKSSLVALYQSVTAIGPRPSVALLSAQASKDLTTLAADLANLCVEKFQQRVLVIGEQPFDDQGAPCLLDWATGQADRASLRQTIMMNQPAVATLALARADQRELLVPALDSLAQLMGELRDNFDLILVLLPRAVNPISAALAQRLTDSAIVVVEAEKTRVPVARQMIHLLREAKARLLGVVLEGQRYYIPAWLYRYL